MFNRRAIPVLFETPSRERRQIRMRLTGNSDSASEFVEGQLRPQLSLSILCASPCVFGSTSRNRPQLTVASMHNNAEGVLQHNTRQRLTNVSFFHFIFIRLHREVILTLILLLIMGTCHSKSEAVVNLASGDPVKCDTSATEPASVMADKDGSATKQTGDNVGLLAKTLSAKLVAIATNESTQEPVSSNPRRRRRRRSSAERRRTSMESRASALSDVDVDEYMAEFLNRARRMSNHLMRRRSSAVSPSSKPRMASVLGLSADLSRDSSNGT